MMAPLDPASFSTSVECGNDQNHFADRRACVIDDRLKRVGICKSSALLGLASELNRLARKVRWPCMLRSHDVRLLLATVSTASYALSATGHEMMGPLAQQINPPSLAAERDNAKLNFLSRQADRFGVEQSKVQAARSVYYMDYVWRKTTLKICFWNGKPEQQHEVMQLASVWTEAVPDIQFDYIENGVVRKCDVASLRNLKRISDIRIALAEDTPNSLYHPQDVANKSGDWAYPGVAVAENASFPVTMNLVSAMRYRQRSQQSDYHFNVRHEFGHALSLVHEHQRALCRGWFNVQQIATDNGWRFDQAQAQVEALNESSDSYGFVGVYNRDSIMQYNFRPSWYVSDSPGKINPCRRRTHVSDLSDLDKIVVASLYQPALNDTPERRKILSEAKQYSQTIASRSDGTQFAVAQAESVVKALASYAGELKRTDQLTIQVYPHKVDEKVVLQALGNLGYPLRNRDGRKLVSISTNVTTGLESDPTNTLLYTRDVSEQDVRYIALSLVKAGIAVKSIQPYIKHKRNGFAERWNLVQVGADITNRRRAALTESEIIDKPLPLFGAKLGT